jgi:hypothetical protein
MKKILYFCLSFVLLTENSKANWIDDILNAAKKSVASWECVLLDNFPKHEVQRLEHGRYKFIYSDREAVSVVMSSCGPIGGSSKWYCNRLTKRQEYVLYLDDYGNNVLTEASWTDCLDKNRSLGGRGPRKKPNRPDH